MIEIDYPSALLDRINKVLSGVWSVPEFRSNYYDFFSDGVPEYELSDAEEDSFSRVQEKLDTVDQNPDSESREHGWVDQDEFIEWLRVELESFEERRRRQA